MPRLGRHCVAALAALLAAPSLAAGAPPLKGVTTLDAQATGFTLVELPRPLTVAGESASASKDRLRVDVKGPGRVRAAGLRATVPAADGSRPALFVFSEGDSSAFTATGDVLPAGTYRLYALVDAGPARVTLKTPQLEGEASLAVDTPTPVVAGPLAPRPTQAPNMVIAGRTETLSSEGLVYADVLVEHPRSAGRSEICIYPEGDGGAAGAYDLDCPGGISAYSPAVDTHGPGTSWASFVAKRPPGPYGFGGNFQYGPFPPAVDGFGAWFSFDPVGAPPLPVAPGTPPVPVAEGGVPSLAANVGRARRGLVRLRAGCPGPSRCTGTARILGGGRPRTFAIAAGGSRTVLVPLDRRGRARLRRVARIRVTVRLQGRDAAGGVYTREARVTVRR